MDSPISILIFLVLLNLVIGNAKNKKKVQKKRQRSFNQDTDREKSTGKQGQDLRKSLDEYRKQIEKEFGGQPGKKTQPQQNRPAASTASQFGEPQKQKAPEPQKRMESVRDEPVLQTAVVDEGPQTEYIDSKMKLEPKKDILKAIIY
ncbi:MAG TPA: hypothetical protein DIT39_01065, partial [Tissierellales bacterium]|nr:hypothetical protein [Tissierellales bacterium]